MGTYYNSCQISNLPIYHGDAVRYILMVKSQYHLGSDGIEDLTQKSYYENRLGREGVYANDFWFPLFVPLRGEYSDRGEMRTTSVDVNDLQVKFWLEYINSRISEYPTESIWEIFSRANEGSLRFNTSQYCSPHLRKKKLPVCQTMIREDVYQHLLSMSWKDQLWEPALDLSPAKIYADACDHYIHNKNDDWKPYICEREQDPSLMKDFEEVFSFGDGENSYVEEFIESYVGSGYRHYRSFIAKRLCMDYSWKDKADFCFFLKDLCDWFYVKSMAESVRHTWHPGTGLGSQNLNFAMAADFHSGLAKIARSERKRCKERER